MRTGRALVASASWGVGVAQLLHLDLSVDHAVADDPASGWKREHFTGVALSGNVNGPWETLIRGSVGVPVQGPDTDGFVLFLAVLKLF